MDDSIVGLGPGWNLIGPVAEIDVPEHPSLISQAFGFSEGDYFLAPYLEPFYGYWMFALEPVDIELR